MLETLKNGKCPFTGQPYNCGACEVYKTLEHPKGKGSFVLHMSLYFGEAIRDGKRGLKFLQSAVGNEHPLAEVEEYFTEGFRRGADHHPIGECDRFCFRRGCMGHPHKKGDK